MAKADSKAWVVLTTAGSQTEAGKIAQALLKSKAAACINIIPQVKSRYWWKGKIEQGRESLLIIKTAKSQLSRLSRTLKQHHSYTLPELIGWPIPWADSHYQNWLLGSLLRPKNRRIRRSGRREKAH